MIYEVCNLHSYDGLGDVNNFLNDYEENVPENKRFLALDIALKSTPTRWCNTHKKNIGGWQECRRLRGIRFEQIDTEMEIKYDGECWTPNPISVGVEADSLRKSKRPWNTKPKVI